MNKFFFSLFSLLCFSLLFFQGCSKTTQHQFAICAMFKNEAPWLKEWIVYHRDVLGADHFYLYQNDSTDHYAEVLRPFIEEGTVELIEWNSSEASHRLECPSMDAPWVAYQIGAYNECLRNRAFGKAKWVAMIDIDEFIVPVQGVANFHELLKKAEKKKQGSIRLSWRVFGTSHVESLQEGELLTEKMTWRSEDQHEWNRLCKSIHRPEAVRFCMIHEAESLYPGFSFEAVQPEEACVHHYWTRTRQFCLGRRGVADLEDLNKKQDMSMLQFVPKLRNSMNSLVD